MSSVLEIFLGTHLREMTQGLLEAIRHAKEDECAPCTIPETECPPRCVDTIRWVFGRGATPEASVVVRNTGKQARTFSFKTTPLAGAGTGTAAITVSPASANLAPGDQTVVKLRLQNSDQLTACQDYRAEFLFSATWERCVKILCSVVKDSTDSCTVSQSGETTGYRKGVKTVANFGKPRVKPSIDWKIERGVEPTASLTIRNEGTETRSFAIASTPWVGPGGAAASLNASPPTVDLASGQTAVVELKMLGSAALSPGQEYRCEVVVDGFEESRIDARCMIKTDPTDHADAEQGEFPTRIRAHQWYEHFQCTEDCVVPRERA